MQSAPALDPLELPLNADDPLLNEAAVGFNLAFARSAEKTEAAALSLKMGPRAHEARALIVQMGQLHLQRALGGARSAAEDFEDQPGAVDHLAVERPFKISLLRRRQRTVEDDEIDPLGFHFGRYGLDLALADVSRRPNGAQRHGLGADHGEVDGPCQTHGLIAPRTRGCATGRPVPGRDWDRRPKRGRRSQPAALDRQAVLATNPGKTAQ